MIVPYIDNNYFLLYPTIPTICEKPPTIYSILDSIVNYHKEDKQKMKDLAKFGRTYIFDFDYPLTDNISKKDFECQILNRFLMRRIGFDTVNLFKIQLDVKLNEIMPMYNKMFDSLENWNIFNDGEKTERDGYDNRITTNQSNTNTTANNTTNDSNTSDRRNSDTPQNKLEDVRDGSYVTDYNYDTNTASSNSNSTGTSQNNSNTHDDNTYHETIKHTNANKIEIMKQMQQDIKSIYTLIFNDLDCLFYQLV
jgi:hypothetical protein